MYYQDQEQVLEEEQEKYPDPTNPGKFYKNKMDMKNLKRLMSVIKKAGLKPFGITLFSFQLQN